MKVCSKCKQVLDENCFVKSSRYRDGLYPSCKECRKAVKMATLAANPKCSKCGVKPHQPTHPYCYDCLVEAMGYTPKFRRDSKNKLCSRCKVNPRAQGKNYCSECANRYLSEYYAARGGQWKNMTAEQRRKHKVRHFANWLVEKGEVERGPCVFCGAPSTQFHHYDYEDRTRNFDPVCDQCHLDCHEFLDSMLTMMKMGAQFPQLSV